MFLLIDLLVTKAGQINVPRFYAAKLEKLVLSRDLWNFPRRGEARQTFHEARQTFKMLTRSEARRGKSWPKRSEARQQNLASFRALVLAVIIGSYEKLDRHL